MCFVLHQSGSSVTFAGCYYKYYCSYGIRWSCASACIANSLVLICLVLCSILFLPFLFSSSLRLCGISVLACHLAKKNSIYLLYSWPRSPDNRDWAIRCVARHQFLICVMMCCSLARDTVRAAPPCARVMLHLHTTLFAQNINTHQYHFNIKWVKKRTKQKKKDKEIQFHWMHIMVFALSILRVACWGRSRVVCVCAHSTHYADADGINWRTVVVESVCCARATMMMMMMI